ncbi:MAG: class I fructose-bisphosphate aldolase [Sulfolobales archaeon]|jgi:class I fructose-bisphosphate aldolase
MRRSFNEIGKEIRLNKILKNNRALIFAFDHGVEHGPKDFPEDIIDPRVIIRKVVEAEVDAIMTTVGIASMTYDLWGGKIPLIIKITGKTSLRPEQQRLLQSVFGYVRDAVALGADAVAATVYWGSEYEDQMLNTWFTIRLTAERYGLPALQLAYPRGSAIKNMYDKEVVKYGVRAAIESGADLIKTYYTGSEETFREVVKVAAGIPILMSGGATREKPIDFLRDVKSVMRAGANGAVVGRNIFQHKDPKAMIKALKLIIHEDKEVEDVAKLID